MSTSIALMTYPRQLGVVLERGWELGGCVMDSEIVWELPMFHEIMGIVRMVRCLVINVFQTCVGKVLSDTCSILDVTDNLVVIVVAVKVLMTMVLIDANVF